jgi:uncharacterized membrane protein
MAIIITIMVLELKVPKGDDWSALTPLLPVFGSYVLSFIYLGIYWNNHHHLLQAAETVSGSAMWANMHLLFWLSLVPFVTGWMGANEFRALPAALYGGVLLMSGLAYSILARALLRHHAPDSVLARAIGGDRKGNVSLIAYAAAIPLAFLNQWIALAIYAGVAALWFLPDPRIETALEESAE